MGPRYLRYNFMFMPICCGTSYADGLGKRCVRQVGPDGFSTPAHFARHHTLGDEGSAQGSTERDWADTVRQSSQASFAPGAAPATITMGRPARSFSPRMDGDLGTMGCH
jgi:hypothetical protein